MKNTRHVQGLVWLGIALSIVGVFMLSSPVLAKSVKQPHTPSGLTDSKGNMLFVESSSTPDVTNVTPLQTTSQTAPVSSFATTNSAQVAQSLGPNLIPNPSVESTSASGLPVSWSKGGYGTNTRVLSYPVTPAAQGTKAIRVAITSYTSGDAKWYFTPISITAGQTYEFSDDSFSDVSSEIDAQVTLNDGTTKYIILARPGPSSVYQTNSAQFIAPAGATTLTIFHVINQVGSLTVDNYSLNQVTTPPPSNLVPNGDFETAGSNGFPANWIKGGWGTNTRTLSYPVTGVGGSRAVQVSISSYTSGDAKWYFAPIVLPIGIYTYSDTYESNVSSIVTIQYHNADGTYTYQNLAEDPAVSSFTSQTIGFVVPSGTQDVSIFHLINSVGTMTLDNVAVQKNTDTSGVFQNGAVTLTFDNGWLSQYQYAVPKMDQYGFKGTFYIITHELSDFGYTGFLSKAQIKNMYADGQEIGSHTQTHPYLTTLSPNDQQTEIQGSRQDLLAMNVGPIDSFAYPYGDYDATSLQLVKDAGYTNARSTIRGNTVPQADKYQLPDFVVTSSTTPSQIEGWVDEAIAEKSWLIIEFHQVDPNGDTYNITPTNFNTVMDYLAQKHVSVVTMAQGVQSLSQ